MDSTLTDFIRVLRGAGLRVSVAESIDAHLAVRRIGLGERGLLKDALAMTLAKSHDERRTFEDCFERFFTLQELSDQVPEAAPAAEEQAAEAGSSTGGGAGGPSSGRDRAEVEVESELARQLLAQDWANINVRIAAAGQRLEISQIVSFVQRGRYTRAIADELDLQGLDRDIARLDAGSAAEREAAGQLERDRAALLERIGEYVDRQVALFADPEYRQQLQGRLSQSRLAAVDPFYYQEMQELVRRMAKRLVAQHSRRKKAARRGQLDFRRTLRSGLAYDGVPFEPRWRRIKKDQPRIMVLCDVSGSVAAASRFLLMFLHSVSAVLPKVRSFVFSDNTLEVTELFQNHSLEEAVREAMRQMGERSSDYGNSLKDFERLCLDDIDRRTTVIVLGDARSNYGDPGISTLRKVYRRARQVIWLNPEPRVQWGTGDSEMPVLATACHRTRVCNTLKHLEQLVEELMRA